MNDKTNREREEGINDEGGRKREGGRGGKRVMGERERERGG